MFIVFVVYIVAPCNVWPWPSMVGVDGQHCLPDKNPRLHPKRYLPCLLEFIPGTREATGWYGCCGRYDHI